LFISRKYISSPHAKIICEEDDYYIVDIGKDGKGSKYGTFVNEDKLEPQVKLSIKDGDIIKLCRLDYTFHVVLMDFEQQIET